jgi:DNA-binding CsgD family transcriptional regulator
VQALGPSDPAAAADLSRQTLELTTAGHPLQARLVADTALLLHAAGRVEEGARFADGALRAILPAEQEAEVRLSIAGMFSVSPDTRAQVGKTALALPGLSDEMRARHHARLVHSVLSAGRPSEARALIEQGRDSIDANGGDDAKFALALAQGGLSYTAGEFGAALEQIIAAIRSNQAGEDDGRLRLAQQWRAEVLFVLDRSGEALDVLLDALSSARKANQAWAARWFELWRGRHLLQVGRLADAAATLEGFFEDQDPRPTANVVDAVGFAALGRIALHTGGTRANARIAGAAEQMLRSGPPGVRRHGAWLLALEASDAGDDRRAIARLLELGEDGGGWILPVMAMDVTDPARLTRMALRAERPDIARAAVLLAEYRQGSNPGVPTLAAVAAHARGLLDDDRAALDAAIEAFAEGPRVLALASAREDRAGILLAGGERDAAIRDLTRALGVYADSGASHDAGRVRGRLREVGVRRRLSASARPARGWAGLTESELLVVRLVGEGLTNRETAARLFLSPHTVSMHLRHAFSKLGINSRVELARIVLEHDRKAD